MQGKLAVQFQFNFSRQPSAMTPRFPHYLCCLGTCFALLKCWEIWQSHERAPVCLPRALGTCRWSPSCHHQAGWHCKILFARQKHWLNLREELQISAQNKITLRLLSGGNEQRFCRSLQSPSTCVSKASSLPSIHPQAGPDPRSMAPDRSEPHSFYSSFVCGSQLGMD